MCVILQCVLVHVYNYHSFLRIKYCMQLWNSKFCEWTNRSVHVSAHLTMVKSLYLSHYSARRKGGGGEQRSKSARKKNWISWYSYFLSFKTWCYVLKLFEIKSSVLNVWDLPFLDLNEGYLLRGEFYFSKRNSLFSFI